MFAGARHETITAREEPRFATAPVGALRHIGLYAYRAGYLRQFPKLAMAPLEQIESLEQLRVLWHGDRIVVHIAEHAPPPGVDTPEDLARVRAIFEGRDRT